MKIAVIGAGRVGSTLGGRWADTGHEVVYGVRDPADAKHAGMAVATATDAVAGADVVLIALPWAATEVTVSGLPVGDAIVIDATNPLEAGTLALSQDHLGSGGEAMARWTGSTRVVKAFNTTGSANMGDTTYPGATITRPAMFMAGDDVETKVTVGRLAAELGFDPIDGGPLSASADLEHLAQLWIRMAFRLGNGPGFAFAVLRR